MADREMIAATLAAGVLSNHAVSNVARNEEGAEAAVEFYHEVLAAFARYDADADARKLMRVSQTVLDQLSQPRT